jgi:F420H(2)-dependent quinone reductase
MPRWVIKMAARRIRHTGKMMGPGFNALILTTVGARSGAQRTNPVGWFPGTDGSWPIVASAAGAARNPARRLSAEGALLPRPRERRMRDLWTSASVFLPPSPAFPAG